MLTTIRKRLRVGADGNVVVPVGAEEAGREVDVTVSAPGNVRAPRQMTQQEWEAFIERLAGSIHDPTFRRHDQGDYDERLPFE
jgi:hypothetical protein